MRIKPKFKEDINMMTGLIIGVIGGFVIGGIMAYNTYVPEQEDWFKE